ncbi:MAG: MFS transporter [Steroidobacterales bacterium]
MPIHDMAAPRPAHPVVYMLLVAPFGAMQGYVTVAIAYLLAREGLPVVAIAGLVGSISIPHSLKFLWAPLVDTTLSRKTWYLVSAVISALGIVAIGFVPATERSLPVLYALVLISNFAVTFVSMSSMSIMAYDTPPEGKGRASGWSQAGNLGGAGLGGGAGLWLAQKLPAPWMAGAVIAAACLGCCAALLFVREPPPLPRGRHFGHDLAFVARDLWTVAKSRTGMLGLLICFLPLGTGAASNLWSPIASDWHAGLITVAIATGAMSGVITAAGCFIGGWWSDRMHRQGAYALYGVLLALCAAGMAIAPRTELMYVVFTSGYALITGMCYAGWSAVTLEAIGTGAAATKYQTFSSLSNVPIGCMTVVDGWSQTQWGSGSMLLVEAAIGIVAVGTFAAAAAATRSRLRPAFN